jgi:hypothetical protein
MFNLYIRNSYDEYIFIKSFKYESNAIKHKNKIYLNFHGKIDEVV